MSDQLNIRVSRELKAAFIEKAKEDGTTATDLIVAYMKSYLELEGDLPVVVKETSRNQDLSDELKRIQAWLKYVEQKVDSIGDGLGNRIDKVEKQLADHSAVRAEWSVPKKPPGGYLPFPDDLGDDDGVEEDE